MRRVLQLQGSSSRADHLGQPWLCLHLLPSVQVVAPSLPRGDPLLPYAALLCAVGLLPSLLYAGMLLFGLLLLAPDCDCLRCTAIASSKPLRSCKANKHQQEHHVRGLPCCAVGCCEDQ